MSTSLLKGYVAQDLKSRYIRLRILEDFLKANVAEFGKQYSYDASAEDIIVVHVKRKLTETEIDSLQKKSYPKGSPDDADSD